MNTNSPQASYQPTYVSPPGSTLLEMLEERHMSQAELAQRMGRPTKTINEIIRGKAAITAETALQLEKIFSTPARFWLTREQNYREFLARQRENSDLTSHQTWSQQFPIAQMQQRGWLPPSQNKQELLQSLLQFFSIAHPEHWGKIWQNCRLNYRKTEAYQADEYDRSVWLRQGEIQAQEIFTDPYNEANFHKLLRQQLRPLVNLPIQKAIPQLIQLCASVGVAVVIIPEIGKTRAHGVARWLTKDKALIQISHRYKTVDQFWFSFFHEAAHILKHTKKQIFIENDPQNIPAQAADEMAQANHLEAEADQFARDILIPPSEYDVFIRQNKPFSAKKIGRFAQQIETDPSIIVGRLQRDKLVPYHHFQKLKKPLRLDNIPL